MSICLSLLRSGKESRVHFNYYSKVEVVLRNLENKQIEGTSNSERIVYGGLRKGLYQIESPLLNKTITIRLK